MTPTELEALVRTEMNRLRGKYAGYVEACGLPERQERSLISTMKSFSYDAEGHIADAINE